MKLIIAIMTFNEENNIGKCLQSCDSFPKVVMCDSYSNDNTVNIANSFSNVQVIFNKFHSWGDQRNHIVDYIRQNLTENFSHVLFIDADEFFSKSLLEEIQGTNLSNITVGEFPRSNIFLGISQRFSYAHPLTPRLYNIAKYTRYHNVGAREYYQFSGSEIRHHFKNPIIQEDLKPLSDFLYKQISNAQRESQVINSNFNENSMLKYFIRKYIWESLPLPLRPILYFFYRYIINLGFIDGKAGFYYIFYQSLVYQMNISLIKESISNNASKSK